MKVPTPARLFVTVVAVGLISACAASGIPPASTGDEGSEAGESEPAATRAPFATTSPLESERPIEGPAEVPDDVWAAIIDALETRLDGAVAASAVELVSAEAVTWNDGSLGCPKAGEVYTQALVDGVRVVVEVDGDEYDFRVPRDGEPQLCESDLPRGG